jgi:hypothetical protein
MPNTTSLLPLAETNENTCTWREYNEESLNRIFSLFSGSTGLLSPILHSTVRHDCTRQFCEIVHRQNNEVDVLKKWKLQRNFLASSKKTEKEVLDVQLLPSLFP